MEAHSGAFRSNLVRSGPFLLLYAPDLSRGITAGEFYNGAEFSACAHAQNIAILREDVILCFVFTNKNDNICRKFLGKICDFRTVNSTYIYVHF